jgi:signal transduction histidine kinase
LTLTVSAVDGLDLYVLVVNDISQRRHLERDVVRAAAAEQARIGREIHDGVGQGLTATGMLAASLVHDLESAGCAAPARRAQELSQHLQGLAQEMRTLARGLSPVELDPEGLSDALAALARSVPEGRFSHAGTVRLRDDTAATHLYRIAQEAVNNALKHASARRIDIRLECRGRKVILSVEDDGCGIVPMRRRRGRLGLAIMRYRAQALGGRLEVAPRPDGGTRVRCVVPLHSEGG